MKLIFDTFGGDYAPFEVIKGAVDAYKELGVDICLVGDSENIETTLKELEFDGKADIIEASEKIENTEDPAFALRRKKNSSTVVGLKALKEGKGDAFISAGSTGALLAGGLFITKRIDNIKRAALPTVIPSINGNVLVMDSGANMDCDPKLLAQFALMGKVYYENLMGVENPTIALLNVGTEEGKGNLQTKEAYKILKEMDINFIGNIEARDVTLGGADVVICDGFAGNILLKNTEGVAKFLYAAAKSEMQNAELSKENLMAVQKVFGGIFKKMDYKEYGGTLLLGLRQVLIKAHGDSDAFAIKNAAKAAVKAVENNIIETLENNFKEEE